MRIKFLSVIASFLFLSIAFTACLDSDSEYEYSSDASVYAFGIDTIYGKHYAFSIDQVQHLIFNKDSLPLGSDTLLDSILVDTFTVKGYVTTGGELDSIFQVDKYYDLRGAINEKHLKFKIHALDAITTTEYSLSINVHKQNPDSFVWNKIVKLEGENLSAAPKTVILNDELVVLASERTVVKFNLTTLNDKGKTFNVNTLPKDVLLNSAVAYQNKLYITTAQGLLYCSDDAVTWKQTAVEHVSRLLAAQSNVLMGIRMLEDKKYFSTTTDGVEWTEGLEVPENFPLNAYSYVNWMTANGIPETMIVGNLPGMTKTEPWFTTDGKEWALLAAANDKTACPVKENPSIMYYDDQFYVVGQKLDTLYYSNVGISWKPAKKRMVLPKSFAGKTAYSMTVDKQNFVWMVLVNDDQTYEVWRGRLNRLGFIKQ